VSVTYRRRDGWACHNAAARS